MRKKLNQKNQKVPCKECAFLKTVQPGLLGGSSPETYIGQAQGPFMVPCHMLCDFSDPQWRGEAFETGQCAGMAVYRANLGLSESMPDALHPLPPSKDVFESHEAFLAHHKGIPLREAKAQLLGMPPKMLMALEMNRPTIMIKDVPDSGKQ